jgi:hypothetical protein
MSIMISSPFPCVSPDLFIFSETEFSVYGIKSDIAKEYTKKFNLSLIADCIRIRDKSSSFERLGKALMDNVQFKEYYPYDGRDFAM